MSLMRALRRSGAWIVIAALVGWLNAGLAYGPHDGGRPGGSEAPLENYLNADGTLNLPDGFSGSLNPAGWEMGFNEAGEPIFTRAAAALPAFLADGDENWNPDREYNAMGANGTINAVVVDASGNTYIGGSFSKAGGRSAPFIAKFEDRWVSLADDFDGEVWALAIGPNGHVYAGGEFTTADGDSVHHVAVYDGSSWSALGSGTDGPVYALTFSGNDLYIGGDFATAGGTAASHIALYNTLNDTWSDLGDGTSGAVRALAVTGGNVYAGGSFATAGGTTVNNIARWSIANELWFSLENPNTSINGVTGTVYALGLNGTDLYIGGDFTLDVNGSTSATNLALWDGGNYERLYDGGGEGTNGIVYSISVRNTGTNAIYIGGTFTQAGSQSVNRVAVWDPSSSVFTALDSGQLYAASGTDGTVRALHYSQRGSTDELYVGGEFTSVGSGFTVKHLAYWDLDQTAGDGEWRGLGYGVNGSVYALLVNNGRLYVGGDFDGAGGLPINNVAYLDLSDFSWNRLTNDDNLNGTDGPVYALTTYVDGAGDNIIVVGGDFTDVPSATGFDTEANNLAYWNDQATSGGVVFWGNFEDTGVFGTNGPVYALEVVDPTSDLGANNPLWVGGGFTTATGTTVNNIAYFTAVGNSGATNVGTGFDGPVYALFHNSTEDALYVGGTFTTGNGTSMSNLAMVDDPNIDVAAAIDEFDGTASSGVNGPVYALDVNDASAALSATNPLFIGGDFTSVSYNSTSASISYLAAYDGTDAEAVEPEDEAGVNGPVYALYFDGTNLYAGGAFTTANGVSAKGVAYATYDAGSVESWNAQGSGVNSTPRAIVASTNIYYGGEFTQSGDGQPSYGITMWEPPDGASGSNDPLAAAPTLLYLSDAYEIQAFSSGGAGTEGTATSPLQVTISWNAVEGAANYKVWYENQAAVDDALTIDADADYFGPDTTLTLEITTAANVALEFVICGTQETTDSGDYSGGDLDITNTTGVTVGSDGPCLTDGVDDDNSVAGVSGIDVTIADGSVYPTYNGQAVANTDMAPPASPTSVVATVIIPDAISPKLYSSTSTSGTDIGAGDAVVAVYTDPNNDGELRGAGYGRWDLTSGRDLVFNIYGDDPVTAAKEGFAPGEYIRFLVADDDEAGDWDATWYIADVTFENVTNEFSSNTIYEATSFNAYALDYNSHEHLVTLQQGWNLMSTYLDPYGTNGTIDDDVEDIFSGASSSSSVGFLSGGTDNFGLMRNITGAMYYPAFDINAISTFDADQGYQIYMSEADTLRIRGSLPGNSTVALGTASRWYLIPYLRNERLPVEEILADYANDIAAVRDNAGNAYIPAFGINQIEWLRPGQAYYVYPSGTPTIDFGANSNFVADSILSRKDAQRATLSREGDVAEIPEVPVPVQSSKYQPVSVQTGSSATLILQSAELRAGDEIGVWNQAKQVVGVGVVEDDGQVAVTIWGDDELVTPDVVDGAKPGEELALTIWLGEQDEEYPIEVQTMMNVLTEEPMEPVVEYQENAVLAAEADVAGIEVANEGALDLPTEFAIDQNYPNPFNPVTTIRYALPEASNVTLKVYDLMGREVATLVSSQMAAGHHVANWDSRNAAGQAVSSGVYFYRITAGSFTQTKRMVLLK